MAETEYDPYAPSDLGKRALSGEYIDSMRFYWFDPYNPSSRGGYTTGGWSSVPDHVKPYVYLDQEGQKNARTKFLRATVEGYDEKKAIMEGLLSSQEQQNEQQQEVSNVNEQEVSNVNEQGSTYDPYADSDIGRRAFDGEYIDSMNFYWFNPNTQEVGSTTKGWSRVPDEHKRYTYLSPGARDAAETKFFQSGASGIGVGGKGGSNLLSGLDFARSIAGGEAAASMIAPGMSYSMDQPMGYTAPGASRVPFPSIPVEEQPFYSQGPAPVLNLGTGQGAYDPTPNQMPYAPPGTTIEKFIPTTGKAAPETRPTTVAPLGSLDTEYTKDIDFSGLLNTPEPQVDFPASPTGVIESVMANQPVYQDPIMNMVEPVANNEIAVTEMMGEPSYQSLGASLFDNKTIIPASPDPMPLVDLGLLNEPMAVPQNNTPFTPLNIFDAPINFNPASNYGR